MERTRNHLLDTTLIKIDSVMTENVPERNRLMVVTLGNAPWTHDHLRPNNGNVDVSNGRQMGCRKISLNGHGVA